MNFRRIDTRSPKGIQGGIGPAPPEHQIQLYIAVDDVSAYAEKAVSRGAKILVPPTLLPGWEEMAVLLDPQRTPFAVYRRSGH